MASSARSQSCLEGTLRTTTPHVDTRGQGLEFTLGQGLIWFIGYDGRIKHRRVYGLGIAGLGG